MLLILITAAILSFMIFFPAVVATSVFKVLDEKASSKFLRIFFPKYYLFGFILSCLGLLTSILKQDKISLFFFIFISLSFIFSKQILMPMINKAKDESKEIKFNKLHKLSVFINLLQIISCVVLLVMYLK
ncbi:DUF4149 domain-containing protein [Alphaproteobacteria bacterium]|nr:DUF4149 domain-containing protein [Alphaproteobacteria bacterium]MDA9807129.1 DUF4149 domain-containing protein [Alphaproteobacteria bacterium]MDC6452260.1 DUF4149 domain-containing protein [Alphaproteobacteria bacterium]